MPRPKVLPSQRQRASEACNSCREAKKRCSGTAPCTHCMRRGIGDSCLITNRPRGHRNSHSHSKSISNAPGSSQDPIVNHSRHKASVSSATSQQPLPTPTMGVAVPLQASPNQITVNITPPPRQMGIGPISPSESRTTVETDGLTTAKSLDGQAHDTSHAEERRESLLSGKPSSRMLLNLRGERVYIGGGGSLSFLQLVRGIVSDQIGPSQFSRQGNSETMLEKESPQSHAHTPGLHDLSPEARLMCAENYYALTGGFLDLFLPKELESILAAPKSLTRQAQTLADLVVAIGLQCEASHDSHERELAYFRDSQTQAFAGMLEDPDIDMVRIFLVMSFYLLGECRRNTAFLYLGVATRAAVALGLHSKDTYGDMNDPKHQLRIRVWMSLRVLDIVVNSILGRPAATIGIHSDVENLVDDLIANSKDTGLMCLGASYKLVPIISHIVHHMYDRKEITIPAVEDHLQQLDRWSQTLPDLLRTPPSSTTLDTNQGTGVGQAEAGVRSGKGAIGRVHVSVLYYFAVTLVTRPILVSTLTQQRASGLVHSQLASACLDAAMFIVQTCSGALKVNILQANMCILKAILFPAGLVLGFEIFAKGTVDYGVESGFQGARELLSYFGRKSPQAALYYDILTSLSTAISDHRQRAINKGKSSYVSKIFNFDPTAASTSITQHVETTAAPFVSGGSEGVVPVNYQDEQVDDILATWSFGQNTPVNNGEMFLDWDSLDISNWDSFPYVNV